MTSPLRTLLPPGGFSNLVGHHMAALDLGLESLRAVARARPAGAETTARATPALCTPPRPGAGLPEAALPEAGRPSVETALRAAGRREAAWLHGAVGKVPSPAEPDPQASVETLLGWLDTLRTVSLMVLRPLADRDLERLVSLPDVPGKTTLRRLLSELLEHQAERRAEVRWAPHSPGTHAPGTHAPGTHAPGK